MSKLDDFKAVVTTATDELRAAINAAGDVLAGDTPPPPPPPGGTSPDGTEVTPTNGGQIIDNGGHVWTMSTEIMQTGGNAGSPKILKDGSWEDAYEGAASLMTIKAGVVYLNNGGAPWWRDTGTGWALQFSAP